MTVQTLEQVITAWYTDDARGSHLDFDDVYALVKRITAALPTREQIAEALRVHTTYFGQSRYDVQADAVLALLPHPTPTAEPWYERTPRTDEQFVADLLAKDSEPPRIEDMAPGTTCPECHQSHRFEEDSEFHLGLVCSECGSLLLPIGTRFIGQEHAGDLQPLVFTISGRGTATISEPSVMGWPASLIDPSTIRDVQIPREATDE